MENNSDRQNKNRKIFNRVFLAGVFAVLLALSFWLGFFEGKKNSENILSSPLSLNQATILNKENGNKNLDFSPFWKALDLLKEKHIDSNQLDSNKILYGAIKGMFRATGDPYTVYLDPEENRKFNEDITGNFEGIGAEMGIKGGILTVIAPLEDSPAEKAGLRAGDKIIKIDGENSADMLLEEAVNKIRGAKGTEVKLTIWRNGNKETQEITVQRDVINVKSVKIEDKSDGIFYIKISRFGEDASREFSNALSAFNIQKAKGIILDLRNNPGGYLDAAISIAGKMLPKNKVVVIEEGRQGARKEILARGGDILSQIPMVIIINEGSASASEILAGALRENRENAALIGKKTFGKGSVQELIDLPLNTAAKITVDRWLTPSGNQINEVGISPDVEVDLADEDYNNNRDPQLDKAMEIIKEKIAGN